MPGLPDPTDFARNAGLRLVLVASVWLLASCSSPPPSPWAAREIEPGEMVPLPDASFRDDVDLVLPEGFAYEELPFEVFDPTDLRVLPKGDLLAGNRAGEVLLLLRATGETRVLHRFGAGGPTEIHDSVFYDLGVMGLAVDPGWPATRRLYATVAWLEDPESFAGRKLGGSDYHEHVRNGVFRLDLDDQLAIEGVEALTPALPGSRFHNIGHCDFGPDGHLYVSMGDATTPEAARDLARPQGKILRLDPDRPLAGTEAIRSSVAAYGLRNAFGLSVTSAGELILPENGPQDWDELSVVSRDELEPPLDLQHPDRKGFRIVGGELDGRPAETADSGPATRPPLVTWHLSICPTAALRYEGDAFPSEYRGRLFQLVGAASKYPKAKGGLPSIGQIVTVRETTGPDGSTGVEVANFLHCRIDCGTPTALREGPDGSLYMITYLYSRAPGTVFRIWHAS